MMSQQVLTARRIILYTAWYLGVTLAGVMLLDAQELREEFHRSYPLSADGRVSIRNVNGAIRVSGWDRHEVKVDAVKQARTPEALRDLEIQVDARADAVDIRTHYGNREGDKDHAAVEYTVTVPRNARLDQVKTVNGAIEVEGISGEVKASSVNGSVTARRLGGGLDLATVNGRVEAGLERLQSKPVSLKSVNGTVALIIPPAAGARLRAQTVHGDITGDFDIPVRRAPHGPGRDLETTIGTGGPEVRLSTVNGGIRVRRQ
jgi:hypothetical protein